MTRLSCHRFRSDEVRLWLSVLAYNLGNLWRRVPSGPGAAAEDRQLVAHEFAAAVGKDRGQADQARAVLLVDAGGESSDQAAVWGDGRKDRRPAGGDGIDAGDGRSEIRRPGVEGRRGFCGMHWKGGVCGFWFLAAGRKWRWEEPKTAPKAKTATRGHKGRRLGV
jgi:hypothetical protein